MTAASGSYDVRRWGGFLCFFGLTSVSLSAGFIWAKQGRAALTFLSAFAAWMGYLFAHYAATGQFIDGGEAINQPNRAEMIGLVAGGTILTVGMTVGSQGIRMGSFLITELGSLLFLSGYVIAHYIARGTLL